jgi:hypothetical protein
MVTEGPAEVLQGRRVERKALERLTTRNNIFGGIKLETG